MLIKQDNSKNKEEEDTDTDGVGDPDAQDQKHLLEDDMGDRIRVMEKFLVYWLPIKVYSLTNGSQSSIPES